MTERIRIICECLPEAETFADIGCDHGYCSEYMLGRGLCKRAYISDISRESLKKAERLLERYVKAGSCIPVCADGLEGIPEPCGLVLIAGMGGEEIVRILSKGDLPEKFVLQPMKNADKVRKFLLERGAKITRDFVFEDGKYYELIAGEGRGGDEYTDHELSFGRDNLLNPTQPFLRKIRAERDKLRGLLSREMKREARFEILEKITRIEEVVNAIDGDL